MISYHTLHATWQFGSIAIAAGLLIAAACCDLLFRIIPDWISVALAAVGLSHRAPLGLGAVATSIGLAMLLFAALALVHARGGLGGGDVKLFSAAALCLPPWGVYQMMMGAAFTGGGLALIHFALRRLPRPACSPPGAPLGTRIWTIERWRWRRPDCLPYGVAIACGGIWALLSGTGP